MKTLPFIVLRGELRPGEKENREPSTCSPGTWIACHVQKVLESVKLATSLIRVGVRKTIKSATALTEEFDFTSQY